MAPSRKQRKKSKKSSNKNGSTRSAAPRMTLCVIPLGLLSPDRVRVWLRYANAPVLNVTTVGSLYSYQMRGNGPFDPDKTGTGSQPNGYDQWAPAFYQRQVTVASRCRVTSVNNGSASATQLNVVLIPSASALTYSDTQDAAGDARGTSKFLGLQSGGHDVAIIDKTMRTAAVFGIKESDVTASDNCSSLYSATPTNEHLELPRADAWIRDSLELQHL